MFRPNVLQRVALVLIVALAIPGRAAASIVVNSTSDAQLGDDGICTLREAITAAATNAPSGVTAGECAGGSPAPTVDQITFAIPATDPGCKGTPTVCTIKPATALPDINGGPVFIDGYTQAGASANTLAIGDDRVLTIEIDAGNGIEGPHVAGSYGGSVSGSGSTIRGLAITHMSGNGLCISCSYGVDASNVTIVGNFIGTDLSGTSNTSSGTGIYVVTSTNVVIGGTAPADRNVITNSGNAVYYSNSPGGKVQGNYVNVDKNGTTYLQGQYGIDIESGGGTLIGGAVAGARNVVSGHAAAIQVNGDNHAIKGNFIGTDATGTSKLGDGYGVIVAGGDAEKIGGTAPGEGNLISGNGLNGIVFSGSPTATIIQGNKIGTDVTGRLPLPNGLCGISAADYAQNSSATIGGTDPGAGNIIAFNLTNGIGVVGANNLGWSILGNSIFGNADLAVTLSGRCSDLSSAATPNDADDVDIGANDLQNYPVITGVDATQSRTTVHVSGTLNSTADTMFRIEFFANAGCNQHGNHGQGEVYVGHVDVATIGHDASFTSVQLAVPPYRHVISATATDPVGNTSEFSLCSDQDTIFSDDLEFDS